VKNPRVLALTHSLSPVDGVGVYTSNTLRHLAPLCDGIDVVIGKRHRGFSADVPRSGVTIYESLPTDHFPFLSLPKLAWVLFFSLPQLVRAARRAHIVHSLSDYPFGFVAALAARLAGRPLVVSGHGTYAVAPAAMPVHRRFLAWMYGRAERVLMGADFAKAKVLEVATPRAIETVPYGCEPRNFDELATGGVAPGVPEPYSLCVGEVKQRKGHHTSLPGFLSAWKERPDIHHVIVGRFVEDDPYYLDLVEQIEALGAGDHVHFLGNVDEGHKVALMRGATAFVLTPTTSVEGGFEAFGLVFLEAGAAGTAVVGTAGSGAESAITDGSNGTLCPADDSLAVGAALGRLFDDEALATSQGDAGRKRAEAQTWEAAAKRVRAVYGEILGGEFQLADDQSPAARQAPGDAPA